MEDDCPVMRVDHYNEPHRCDGISGDFLTNFSGSIVGDNT